MTRHTEGPWWAGPTPSYLMQMQRANGGSRLVEPITIRSPHHSEEIATVWNYLLPTEANARLIALAPRLLAFVESYAEPTTDLVGKLAELDAEADAILKEVGER